MGVAHHAERDDYVRMIATAHHAERDDYVLRRRASARRADLQFASVIRSESGSTIRQRNQLGERIYNGQQLTGKPQRFARLWG